MKYNILRQNKNYPKTLNKFFRRESIYMRQQSPLLLAILLFTSCTVLRTTGERKYNKTITSYIENADLVGKNEIDTGKFILLSFVQSYDVPKIIDEEHEQMLFIKIKSFDDLPIDKEIILPDSSLKMTSYFQSSWSYSEQKNISGKIKRVGNRPYNIQKIKLDLQYQDSKGNKRKLLKGTYLLKKNECYFKSNQIDYNGNYNNLRIALKEPEKVIRLDLTSEVINNNGNDDFSKEYLSLPKEINKFTNLEELNFSLLNLKTLPFEIGQLKKLKRLDLSYNDFETFPAEILSLQNLETLNLQYSNLTSIPKEIAQLKYLKELNLDFNHLTGFPINITNLVYLTTLSLKGDSITVLPSELKNLTKLEKLDMSSFWNYKGKNRPQNLVILTELSKLKELNLELNNLTSLPEEFSQLTNLEVLMIKSNNFKEFPTVIDKIPNLKTLIITTNEFDNSTMNELKSQKKKYTIQIENF